LRLRPSLLEGEFGLYSKGNDCLPWAEASISNPGLIALSFISIENIHLFQNIIPEKL